MNVGRGRFERISGVIQVIKGRRPNQSVGAERRHRGRPRGRIRLVLPRWPTRCANCRTHGKATGEISPMITEIQQSSRNAVGSMDSAVQLGEWCSWRRTLARDCAHSQQHPAGDADRGVHQRIDSGTRRRQQHHCRAGRTGGAPASKTAPLPASRPPRPRPWRNRPARRAWRWRVSA